MSNKQLHDSLNALKQERDSSDIVDSEYLQRLDEIIDSLEQQKLDPDSFDQYSSLGDNVRNLVLDYEQHHPRIRTALESIREVLQNFRV